MKLGSKEEWHAWCTSHMRPANIPSTPDKTYKKSGWQGYNYWLGTVATRDNHGALQTLNLAQSLAHSYQLLQDTLPSLVGTKRAYSQKQTARDAANFVQFLDQEEGLLLFKLATAKAKNSQLKNFFAVARVAASTSKVVISRRLPGSASTANLFTFASNAAKF